MMERYSEDKQVAQVSCLGCARKMFWPRHQRGSGGFLCPLCTERIEKMNPHEIQQFVDRWALTAKS